MPPGSYAVLARVSPGYPPLEGRLATCYSPVRHFTHPDVLLHPNFLVRLACVRHAASVDSEPGSNSRLKLGARLATPETRSRFALHLWSSPAPHESGQEMSCSMPCHQHEARRSAFAQNQRLEAGDRRLAQVSTLKSLASRIRALTWHAQLNCQRTFRPKPKSSGPPDWGATGNDATTLTHTRLHSRLSEHSERCLSCCAVYQCRIPACQVSRGKWGVTLSQACRRPG